MEPEFKTIFERCSPFTMTSVERMYALFQAVQYVCRAGVQGDVVECGVWRGGSSMVSALALRSMGDDERTIWLYDTYEGMSEPTALDRDFRDVRAEAEWRRSARSEHNEWAFAPLVEVEQNMRSTGYPFSRVRLVKGKVEDTIPTDAPAKISVLRLDTDWYESTLHELRHLYPRLAPGGVLIIDDYGWWKGAREATDRYLAEAGAALLLTKIDFTGRVAVKPA